MSWIDVSVITNLEEIWLWKNPAKSASCLVAANVFCWLLQRQRPVYVISLFILANYLRFLWKRVRHEILINPPDCEDWTNLPYYDMERTVIEYVQRTYKSWMDLRRNNYYMWMVLTCLFWIALAKIGSVVSFVTLLFLISNGGFIAGPLFKTFPVELLGPITGGDDDYSEDSRVASAADQIDNVITAEPLLTPSSWGRIIQNTLLKAFDSAVRSRPISRNIESSSSSPMETTTTTESLPNAQPTNGYDQNSESSSSDSEFLFEKSDLKHFESSSSSTSKSNSFELIHF